VKRTVKTVITTIIIMIIEDEPEELPPEELPSEELAPELPPSLRKVILLMHKPVGALMAGLPSHVRQVI
jgi:hypothetical protein